MLKATIEYQDALGSMPTGASDRRRGAYPRIAVGQVSTLRGGGCLFEVTVENISLGGFRFRARDCYFDLGDVVCVGLDGAGRQEAIIVWCAGEHFGCEFSQPLSRERLAMAFTHGNVRRGAFGDMPLGEVENYERWPFAVRASLFLAGAMGSWALVFALTRAILSHG